MHILQNVESLDNYFGFIFTSNISGFPIVTLYFEGAAPLAVEPANYLVSPGGSHLPVTFFLPLLNLFIIAYLVKCFWGWGIALTVSNIIS